MAIGQTQPKLDASLWFRALLTPLFLVVVLGLCAGRADYWQGWLYIGLTVAVMALNFALLYKYPDLIAERLKPGQGMQDWDKRYFALSTPLYIVMLLLAALDVGRFGWSPPMPAWLSVIGALLFLAGQLLFVWAKIVNRFFSSVVRIQHDRGHRVCSDGPYRYVRHPGYVAGLAFGVATPLVLGSWWSLLPALIAAGLLIWRTDREDRFLQRELPGYTEFTHATRYRLLPGVW